jgi:hypothetical protein
MKILRSRLFVSVIILLLTPSLSHTKPLVYTEHKSKSPYQLSLSCGKPSNDSFKTIKEGHETILYFKLQDGYDGRCRSDAKNKRERIEVKSGFLQINKLYKLSFDFKFQSDRILTDWHSILQLKGNIYNFPLLKIQGNKNDYLTVVSGDVEVQKSMKKRELANVIQNGTWKNKWNKAYVEFYISKSKDSYINVKINSTKYIKLGGPHYDKGKIYLKFGLYRNSGLKKKKKEYGQAELFIKNINLN